jgi:hypothetical protein
MEAAIIAAGGCAIWYELIHFAPKALNEVVATNALLPGLYLGMYGERFQEKKRMFLAGIFCGLAMSLRIHLAPAVAFAALYFLYPNWRKRFLPLAAGILLPVVAFGLVDAFTWGQPFQSFLVYYRVHSRGFSVPSLPSADVLAGAHHVPLLYVYLVTLCTHLGPLGFLVLMGLRRSPLLGWIALIHIAFHSFYAAGELRYLYPLVPIEITLAALGMMELVPAFNARRKSPLSSRTIVVSGLAFCALSSCLLISHLNWSRNSGNLAAFDQLSRDPTLCGVGVYQVGWPNIGGYTHLHQNVPIVLLDQPSELEQQAQSFNAVLTNGRLRDPKDGFELAECWNGSCLYHRPGSCTPPQGDNEINYYLWLHGN